MLLSQSADDQHTRADKRDFHTEFRQHRLRLAHKATAVISRHREQYGSSIVPPIMSYCASVSSFVLLQELPVDSPSGPEPSQSTNELPTSLAQPAQPYYTPAEALAIEKSFAEVFRCLLSAGTRHLLSRGVARATSTCCKCFAATRRQYQLVEV